MGASRSRRGLRWLVRIALAAFALVLILVMVTAARGVYDVSPYPVAVASAPKWAMPCFHSMPRYNHEPQCARVRGRVVWREQRRPRRRRRPPHRRALADAVPGGEADRAAGAMPAIGSEVEAVGFTTVGASGEREIVAEALWR